LGAAEPAKNKPDSRVLTAKIDRQIEMAWKANGVTPAPPAEGGGPVAVHCENQDIADRGVAWERAAGRTDPAAHGRSRPPVSETEAVGRVLELAYGTDVRVHIVHASVPRSFDLVERFEWETARVVEDTRRDYGETRLQVLALLDGRLYAAVVTPRGEDLRVISLRKANRREVERYGKKDR